MFETVQYTGQKQKDYETLLKQLTALNEGETDSTAILANASALLKQGMSDVNWVGFYLMKDNELVVGPFQGLPACIRIAYGNGVCGTAAKTRTTQRVHDVNQFPGHIACDSASLSELVVPIIIDNNVYGVLDIDSPITNRFDETDQQYMEAFVDTLKQVLS